MEPKDLAIHDAAYWATTANKIKLQAGLFSFTGREYQQEPMQSSSRRICSMKATQGGWTELFVLRVLHGLIHKKYKRGALYLFPTTDDVREFSKSRFGPLIEANPYSIGKYVKPGGKGTDTTSLKKVHDGFLFLRGAVLSHSIDSGTGTKESTKLRGISVDVIVLDESGLMSPEVAVKAQERMGDSETSEEIYLSNPTIPDRGIHATFLESDQRYLFSKCSCGEYTCAVLEFPECVKLRPDGTGYIACKKCGKELDRTRGKWVPQVRDNSEYMHGYQWSQLNSNRNDPAEILAKYNDPPQGNLGDIIRLKIGLPYIASEDRLTVAQVLSCCGANIMPTSHVGPCAMGVDVGKTKHVVIGARTGRDTYAIFKVIKLSAWNDIHDIARKYNVRSAVIDLRPYEDTARDFQKAEPYNIGLCEYTQNAMHDVVWDKDNIVKAYRTGLCDRTHRLIDENRLSLPRRCPEVETFAKQVCGTAKVLETNERTGVQVYRYRKVGTQGDHYRHALGYFMLAASGGRIASINHSRNRQRFAVNNCVI